MPVASGFLQDYAKLRPVPGREGHYAWALPDTELRMYARFILPPIEIWIDRDAQYPGLSADVVQRLAAIYQTSFRSALEPGFPVVDQPGPGVATCRFAITGVTPERPGLRAVDVVPIKAAFNLVRGATGTAAKVARVSAEIDCSDSVTGRALMAGVITGVGEQRFVEGQPITYAHVASVLQGWSPGLQAATECRARALSILCTPVARFATPSTFLAAVPPIVARQSVLGDSSRWVGSEGPATRPPPIQWTSGSTPRRCQVREAKLSTLRCPAWCCVRRRWAGARRPRRPSTTSRGS